MWSCPARIRCFPGLDKSPSLNRIYRLAGQNQSSWQNGNIHFGDSKLIPDSAPGSDKDVPAATMRVSGCSRLDKFVFPRRVARSRYRTRTYDSVSGVWNKVIVIGVDLAHLAERPEAEKQWSFSSCRCVLGKRGRWPYFCHFDENMNFNFLWF